MPISRAGYELSSCYYSLLRVSAHVNQCFPLYVRRHTRTRLSLSLSMTLSSSFRLSFLLLLTRFVSRWTFSSSTQHRAVLSSPYTSYLHDRELTRPCTCARRSWDGVALHLHGQDHSCDPNPLYLCLSLVLHRNSRHTSVITRMYTYLKPLV